MVDQIRERLRTNADARSRSWRTFWQGFAIDVAAAAVLFLTTAVADIKWTAAFWTALGLSLAKTLIQAGVSNMARRLFPPPQ